MTTDRAGVRDWATAICVAAVLLVAGLSGDRSGTELDLLGYLLVVVSGLVLAASRRAPVPVLADLGELTPRL